MTDRQGDSIGEAFEPDEADFDARVSTMEVSMDTSSAYVEPSVETGSDRHRVLIAFLLVCLYSMIATLLGFWIEVPIFGLYAIACLVPTFIWVYFVYWRNRPEHPEFLRLVSFFVIGACSYIPLTSLQYIGIFFLYQVTYNLFGLGSVSATICWMIALLIESLFFRAAAEQGFMLFFLQDTPFITSHFLGTVYGMMLGLGMGTVTISFRVLWVTYYSYTNHEIHIAPLCIWLQHACLTLTMYATVGMWLGLGWARRLFLSGRSQRRGRAPVPYPWPKIILPPLFLQALYFFLLHSVPVFFHFDSRDLFPKEDFITKYWVMSVAVSAVVLTIYVVTIFFMLRRTLTRPAYYEPFREIGDDDWDDDLDVGGGVGGDGGGGGLGVMDGRMDGEDSIHDDEEGTEMVEMKDEIGGDV